LSPYYSFGRNPALRDSSLPRHRVLDCVDYLCYTKIMKTTVLKYNVIIHKQGKNFIANVPTLGISDFGENLENAKKNVKSAILCHVEGLIKTKTEVPAPDTEDYYISQTQITLPTAINFAV